MISLDHLSCPFLKADANMFTENALIFFPLRLGTTDSLAISSAHQFVETVQSNERLPLYMLLGLVLFMYGVVRMIKSLSIRYSRSVCQQWVGWGRICWSNAGTEEAIHDYGSSQFEHMVPWDSLSIRSSR